MEKFISHQTLVRRRRAAEWANTAFGLSIVGGARGRATTLSISHADRCLAGGSTPPTGKGVTAVSSELL